MVIFEIIAPLILLIALGAGLVRIRFLGTQFMADLNKLAFWVALPALLFHSAAMAEKPGSQMGLLLAVLLGASVLISVIAWLASFVMKFPDNGRGTLIQSAFRGNLAYIGIPVLAYSLTLAPVENNREALASGVVVMILMMAFYNLLAVVVLQHSSRSDKPFHLGAVIGSIFKNPLLVSGLAGLLVALSGLHLPRFFDRALEILGAAAVPIALLCIGGALATTTLKGRTSWIFSAALLKVAGVPLLVLLLSHLIGLGPIETRIALIFAATPTAAASYVMVREIGGDETLASGSIALSTLLSTLSLSAALWMTT